MHAHGKNDGINAPQKIVSHVDLRPKKLPCQRQHVDRLFEQYVPVHNAGCIVSLSRLQFTLWRETSDRAGVRVNLIKVIICFIGNKTAISIKYLGSILYGSKAKWFIHQINNYQPFLR